MMRFTRVSWVGLWLIGACGADTNVRLYKDDAAARAPMVRGRPTAPGEFAETGLLVDATGQMCSGTLIAPRLVLTAGHCVPGDGARMQFVPRVRPLPLSRGASYRVERWLRHADYNIESYVGIPLYLRLDEPKSEAEKDYVKGIVERCGYAAPPPLRRAWMQCLLDLPRALRQVAGITDAEVRPNDIALLVLQEPVRDVPCASLPEGPAKFAVPKHATVVGYGFHEMTSLLRLPVAERRVGGVRVLLLGDFEMVAYADSAMVRSGDSGGPLYLDDGGQRQIWGVLSRTYVADNVVRDYAMFTRVDAYISWINEMRMRLHL